MLVPRHSPTIDADTLRSIRHIVDQYIRRTQHASVDRDDLVQDLALHLLQRSANYNSKLGAWSTFVKCVVRNKLRSIHQKLLNESSESPTISLHMPLRDHEGKSSNLADQIPENSSPTQRFRQSRTVEETFESHFDLKLAIETLDARHREVCDRLLREESSEEIRSHLHISERTYYRRVQSVITSIRDFDGERNE